MYVIISLISALVRQFVLPNPFECFGDKAVIINCIAEPVIYAVAYHLVGQFYRKGSWPALGSFLYLLFYSILTGALWICGIFKFAWWWVLILVIAFIGITIGIRWLGNKLSGNDYYD